MSTRKRFQFTKSSIDALPPHDPASPSSDAEYSDSACVGLRLRVSKSGRKFFQHRYTYLGRKMCLSLGEFPAVTLQDARQRVAEHKALLARDKDPVAERNRVRGDLTFAEYADEHYLPHAKAHKKTWEDDVWKIEKRLKPAFGRSRLSAITKAEIERLIAREKARTSACTANHLLATLKRILTLAVDGGHLEKNPAARVEKFKEGPLRGRYLSQEELPRFLRALDEDDDALSVAAIRLLLYTGCRRSEVLSLTWDRVRLDEGSVYLKDTKNGESRCVLLNARATAVLEELAGKREREERTLGSEYLFPSRAGARKGHLYDLRKPFQKACRRAGISGLRIHDLRHSYASLALRSGASLYDVQKLLGHKDISVTQRYAHLDAAALRSATQRVSELVDLAAA